MYQRWTQDLLWVRNPFLSSGVKVANIALDTAAFPELQRAAQLSSAAYTGCLGKAFDVTITKRIDDFLTDTQVDMIMAIAY